MKKENEEVVQSSLDAHEPKRMSRREALAIVGKHAVYTAPAVLAILSVTKSNSAHATPVSGSPP